MTNHDETARRIVQQEVHYCVSSLISELLKTAFEPGALVDEDSAIALGGRGPDADDYANENGTQGDGFSVTVEQDSDGYAWQVIDSDGDTLDSGDDESAVDAWRAAYDAAGRAYPEGAEAFEHWLVSNWLAEKLRDRGESVVDLDNIGLTVWARCTTGQAIYADYVLQAIAADLDESR